MTLTSGTGPFAAGRGAFDVDVPRQVGYVQPWPRRMRAVLAGETVLDSRRGQIVYRSGQFPLWVYPRDDVRADLLERLGHGDAVRPAPTLTGGAGEALADMVEVDFAAMDRWFEEDDPVYAHLRDPYHRVDVRSASQHVVVRSGGPDGAVLADSRRPKLLFETGLPVRYYVPFADVRIDRLELSDTVSECPYKGDGQYWHVTASDGDPGSGVEDAAWSLPHPLPEGIAAAEHLCFEVGKVHVEVDGQPVTE